MPTTFFSRAASERCKMSPDMNCQCPPIPASSHLQSRSLDDLGNLNPLFQLIVIDEPRLLELQPTV